MRARNERAPRTPIVAHIDGAVNTHKEIQTNQSISPKRYKRISPKRYKAHSEGLVNTHKEIFTFHFISLQRYMHKKRGLSIPTKRYRQARVYLQRDIRIRFLISPKRYTKYFDPAQKTHSSQWLSRSLRADLGIPKPQDVVLYGGYRERGQNGARTGLEPYS